MLAPATHYTRPGDAGIAYQTLGDGDCDLVVITGPASHLERMWEEPRTARIFRRMADFARPIMFDRRGTGLSDVVPELSALFAATYPDRVTTLVLSGVAAVPRHRRLDRAPLPRRGHHLAPAPGGSQ